MEHAEIIHAVNSPHGVVTVSMGVCLVRGNAVLRDVFNEADGALYRAKGLGRNRIVLVDLDECTKGGESLLIAH